MTKRRHREDQKHSLGTDHKDESPLTVYICWSARMFAKQRGVKAEPVRGVRLSMSAMVACSKHIVQGGINQNDKAKKLDFSCD